ncbi:putative secondary metabolism biosynthetic enzyme, partial [Claviceps sorghi]
MSSVCGKIVAVTGGASGIGAATCRLLAERGAAVLCLADVNGSDFASTREPIAKINPSTLVQCAKVDVGSSKEVNRWLHHIVSTHGDLHGAANVAGIAQGAGLRASPTILEEKDAEWRRVFDVNLDGVFYATRAQVRAMRDLPCRHRSIVNVASIAAFSHVPDVYAYGTSKNACAYLTTCIAADVFWSGIRVNCVSP